MAIETPAAIERASGPATALNTIVSPTEAFQTLSLAPMWGWAFIIASVLMIAGSLLAMPATDHTNLVMTQNMVAHSSLLANATDAQKQKMIADAQHPSLFKHLIGLVLGPVFVLIIAAIQALILLVGNAAGGGKANYKQLFSATVNIAVVGAGLYWLVLGVIAAVRGPASFSTPTDLAAAVPGLGYFAGGAGAALSTFLASINVFSIWSAVLFALAMLVVARVSKAVAYSFGALILIIGAAFPALFAGMFAR